jgi:hypothetical protein
MKMKPTQHQITAEIEALREQVKIVRKVSAFGDDNVAAIEAQIKVLEENYDEDDIDDFIGDDQQDAARDALAWMDGDEGESPSESWEPLC